jgi:hypothetical protein
VPVTQSGALAGAAAGFAAGAGAVTVWVTVVVFGGLPVAFPPQPAAAAQASNATAVRRRRLPEVMAVFTTGT